MAAAIEQAGGSVTTRVYPKVDHLDIIGALAKPFADWAPVQRDVFELIDTNTALQAHELDQDWQQQRTGKSGEGHRQSRKGAHFGA